MSSSLSRFLTEDPHLRLGARGAAEVKTDVVFCNDLFQFAVFTENKFMAQVKQHVFFKDINWDTLARQKVLYLFLLMIYDLQKRTLMSYAKFDASFL